MSEPIYSDAISYVQSLKLLAASHLYTTKNQPGSGACCLYWAGNSNNEVLSKHDAAISIEKGFSNCVSEVEISGATCNR